MDTERRRTNWTDEHYAQALNTREPGDLPKQRDTDRITINGHDADVPTGRLLNALRAVGRSDRGTEQVLLDALARHGLTPIPHPTKPDHWRLPPTGDLVMWTDRIYAQALDTREPGNLPKREETDRVTINGHDADVPTGRLLNKLRAVGRSDRGTEQVLLDALARHGLTPIPHPTKPDHWRLPPTGDLVMWTDRIYAQALDTREPGNLPKSRDTDRITINGHDADIPTGALLNNLRSKGRSTAGTEQVLLDALARHGLTPISHPTKPGHWRLPPTGDKVMWTDRIYAQALNSREPGNLPKYRDTDRITINGHETDVPTGRLLNTLQNGGRSDGGTEQVLLDALARHGLTPTPHPDKPGHWRLPPPVSSIAALTSPHTTNPNRPATETTRPTTDPTTPPTKRPKR
ncbi:hypothetical protein [Micromonospora yangpuensis]|uniref:Uncharacterized protein n=1 Tax=Micromonospora yangpuensis TaxID=683228 RepID=A0A1C6UUR2_9ACTN|nr:hypothetical protein [Micromonospora yangpuensis]GGM23848.1 hypothetical protein GCM10012279_47730 [Micromonospora yangpuensis]SCL57785.1 hypothetical protein GA0070617_3626 [Micromonospora yangpuensis]